MQSLWIGAAGMAAGQFQLDTNAHNLANVNTNAYQSRRTSFREDISVQLARPAWPAADGLPATGRGVSPAAVLTHQRPGALQATDDPYHLAIEGPGYFPVQTPTGERLYTRDGAFALDAEGRLVGDDGAMLVDADGNPVTKPPDAELVIQADGTVIAETAEGSQVVTVLHLARFVNPGGLFSRGGNLWEATGASGAPQLQMPGADGTILRQGALERANVDVGEEMVAMLMAQRAFQMNARVVQTSDEMMALANQLHAP